VLYRSCNIVIKRKRTGYNEVTQKGRIPALPSFFVFFPFKVESLIIFEGRTVLLITAAL
jgi:hypothetical protein